MSPERIALQNQKKRLRNWMKWLFLPHENTRKTDYYWGGG
jgi:hypothetical protein